MMQQNFKVARSLLFFLPEVLSGLCRSDVNRSLAPGNERKMKAEVME